MADGFAVDFKVVAGLGFAADYADEGSRLFSGGRHCSECIGSYSWEEGRYRRRGCLCVLLPAVPEAVVGGRMTRHC